MGDATTSGRRIATRRVAGALLAVSALVGAGTVVVGTATPAHAATTEVESPDFASEVYGDAWDYANAQDQNTDLVGAGAASVSGGALHVHLTPGESVSPVDSTAGSLPYGRDGAVMTIDPTRYTHLSFEMDQPFGSHIGAVYWWTCRSKVQSCTGGMTFPTVPGDHVYDLDLSASSTLLGRVPWSSARIVAFRLDPVVMPAGQSGDATIAWMRLHGAGGPHAAMPPGNYGTYTVLPRPEPVVDSPNPSQGEDLATTQRGRPWVFTSAANAAGVTVDSARVNGYDARGMNATNTGGDSQVHVPVRPFDGTKYHVLQWDMDYDGRFSLADGPGGGKMARLIWNTSSTGSPQISNDLLTFEGPNAREATVDLTKGDPLDEDAVAPRVGWGGQTVTTIRFDPNEDPGALTWHLRSLHLRATPVATEADTVVFHDAAWVAGATATVTATSPAGTVTVATAMPITAGQNSVPFSLGSAPAGTYTVHVAVTHPSAGTVTAAAPSPVVMQRDPSHDPKGRFDSLTATATGATASGWGFDTDGAPMTVRLYEGSRYLAATTTTIARPDVSRVYPAAPARSGWSAALALAPGAHTICAYGITVGPGQNTVYGCKTVTVTRDTSHDPRGSFDSAVGSTGSTTLSGWAFDPDAASMSVRLYEGGTYLGAVTPTTHRADVARAYPSAPAVTGWTLTRPIAAGTHSICAYGIDVGAGENTVYGCRTVTVR